MGTTQINQITYPSSSDDPDITDVSAVINQIDDLLCPTIPRASMATRYASPDTGALVKSTGENRLDIRRSSKWLTANFKYAPIQDQPYVHTNGTEWVDVPGAYWDVFSGERYNWHGFIIYGNYTGSSDNIEIGWSTPSLTSSSWNVRLTGQLTAKTSAAMTTSKVIGNSEIRFRLQGTFVPSADGVMQFRIRKATDVDTGGSYQFELQPRRCYLALARID